MNPSPTKTSAVVSLSLDKLADDQKFQTRECASQQCITEYAKLMKEQVKFPPITVYQPDPASKIYQILDGHQRLAAARKAGLQHIPAKVFEGTEEAAWQVALQANVAHGLRRTHADKRKAIRLALQQFFDWTDRKIAEACGVSADLVAAVRKPQLSKSDNSQPRRGRDGKLYPPTKRQVSNPVRTEPSTNVSTSTPEQPPAEGEREVVSKALNCVLELLMTVSAEWDATWDKIESRFMAAYAKVMLLKQRHQKIIPKNETNDVSN